MFDATKIKADFPIFKRMINGKPIVYLDSTASSLKPQIVIDAINDYYTKYSVNIFRGVYTLSEEATAKYEEARLKISKFIGCKNETEIVFVRNATEAINLVMDSWGRKNINSQDEIVATVMEHHANLVTWQQLAMSKNAKIKYLDIDEGGYLKLEELGRLVTKKTKLFAITYVSNVLGVINPLKKIIQNVKKINPDIIIIVDGAAAVPHMKVNVSELGCDFFAFSGHKMLGPTGIGVLWGRYELLEAMEPYQYGGEMIREVTLDKTTFQTSPYKFEAGTPHIAGAIGLGAAVDYLEQLDMGQVREHEKELTDYALKQLSSEKDIEIYGPKNPEDRGGVVAFNIKGVHPHDTAQILNNDNVCIRSGHHCAMPLHTRLNLSASCRASFYIYTTTEDIDFFMEGIRKAKKIFS